jgi:two-component sensor histidine kinase
MTVSNTDASSPAHLLVRAAHWKIGPGRSLLISLVASSLIGVARLAATPLLGEEVSFITGAPLVMLAAFFGGRLAGLATIALGSGLALMIAIGGHWAVIAEGWPRLLLWIVSAVILMLIAAELRTALELLRQREEALVDAQTKMKLLVRELEHRGRNALTIVHAMSNDVARSAESVSDYREQLGGRLVALAASYSALTAERSEPVDLARLVVATLKPFARQVDIRPGQDCQLAPKDSLAPAMALHELATNATKYGALSTPGGVVKLSWQLLSAGGLVLSWSERGGPTLKSQLTPGFGSQLLKGLLGALRRTAWMSKRAPKVSRWRLGFRPSPAHLPAVQTGSIPLCARSDPIQSAGRENWRR